MTTVPFRAGDVPGGIEPEASAAFTGAYTLLADVSEFQPDIADGAYLAWSKAIVIRCAYGDAHDDRAWYGGQRRDLLHQMGARFVGIYQYLVAGQPGAAQAQAFRRITGPLRPGEVAIADFEEGAAPVLRDWYREMILLGYFSPYLWTYSGLSFGEAAGVLPVEWIAAYRAAEPSTPHRLWQFTSSFSVPGVGSCDCSVFHGTIGQLAALATPAAAPPPAPAPQYPVPSVSVTVHPSVSVGLSDTGSPHYRVQVARDAGGQPGEVIASVVVTDNHATVSLPGPGMFWVRAQSAGDSPFSAWKRFTA